MVNIETVNQNKILVPARGVTVEIPHYIGTRCYPDLDLEQSREMIHYEAARIMSIGNCTTLSRRFPSSDIGELYMEGVSEEWRDYLKRYSQGISYELANICESIGSKRFAVIGFGSINRGHVRCPQHVDPSNIDIALVGDFGCDDKVRILNAIRPLRISTTSKITNDIKDTECSCSARDTGDKSSHKFILPTSPLNHGVYGHTDIESTLVGLQINTIDSMKNDRYSPFRNYLNASASPYISVGGVWGELELPAVRVMDFYMKYPTSKSRQIALKMGLFV